MIRLTNVHVEGFRLLENIESAVEASTTVVVGRNNSGKTSLTEVFDRFLGERAGKFRLEDFAAAVRPKFLSAKALRNGGATASEAGLVVQWISVMRKPDAGIVVDNRTAQQDEP